MSKGLPVIAIIGRPNVGKSSLINRILRRREAIVHDTPGVTRDRKYFTGEWNNKNFRLIDTGGIYTHKVNSQGVSFQKDIEDQVELAIKEADVIIFLVDGREGLHPFDKNIANLLRPIADKVILAVNKIDVIEKANEAAAFYRLGLETLMPISAMHGLGVGDLLDKALTMFPKNKKTTELSGETSIKVAIVGRPNAGKSSLLNTLLNEERVIVSPTPGTTRDAISEEIVREGRHFHFIDTAGIRKKAKVTDDIEYYSVNRAVKAIEEADIAILLIDGQYGIEMQDKKIAQIIQEKGKGCIIAINKWDIIPKDTYTMHTYSQVIERQIPYLGYAPVLFISAKTKQRIGNIYQELIKVYDSYTRKIETPKFNKTLDYIINGNPPKTFKGKQLKIYYGTQLKSSPPTFLLFVNNMKYTQQNYISYIENQLREHFELTGTPLRLAFRNKQNKKKD